MFYRRTETDNVCRNIELLHSMFVNYPPEYIEYSIIFVDNSGADLSLLQELLIQHDKRIEFISLNPSDFNIEKGKGYNELLLINKAVAQSLIIKKYQAFFKVTGRYPIYNIRYFIDKASTFLLKKNIQLYCDIKDHKIYDWLHLGWCGHSADVRLYAVTVPFYNEHIATRYIECNDYDGHLLEGVFYRMVKELPTTASVIVRFGREPQFGGVEGSNIKAFSFSKNQNSIKGKIKRFIGNSIRIFFPWFYF